ncbi:MAG TPA: DNA recombination protein RmuC [Candidatus Limnocylindria bacterium]|nr:DNA recombination protein RmuC [Candidatus Limnocylindria bacterium]
MDPSIALILAALILGAAAVAVAALRRPDAALPATDAAPVMELLRASVDELRSGTASAIAEMRAELQRTLGATEQQLATQTTSTQRALSDLSRQLGALGEQSARIGELAKDIGSLQDLLRAPKPRGGFGELMLERLLQDCLPASAYEVQYTYRDGSRVDAIVRYGGRVVPVDAKFPNESYTQIALARDDAERRMRRRAFLQQVRKHVDSVARYISPRDQTIDFAFMYLPSEAIYYELTLGDSAPDEPDFLGYCADRHVIPASPNTLLAYLQVVALGIRGLAMQERTRDIQQGIAQVRREFERFVALHDQLGHHLDNATKKFDETERALARASGAVEGLAQVPLAAGGEQGVLPLGPSNDER